MNATDPATTHECHVSIPTWDSLVTRTFEANRTGLIAAAGRIVGRDHAADAAQDAFIRVWSNPALFDATRGTLTKYLYVVVRGVSIDRLRTTTSRQRRDTVATRVPIAAHEPASRLMAQENFDQLRHAMATLRDGEREAISAAYYDHLTYREVALKLNLPEGTVKSRIRIGLVHLRRELGRPGLAMTDA